MRSGWLGLLMVVMTLGCTSENPGERADARAADPACAALTAGLSFDSVQEYECGLGPDGVFMCNWSISFTAAEYTWLYSDIKESGRYTCAQGELVSTTSSRSIAGSYDADTGRLIWDGISYR